MGVRPPSVALPFAALVALSAWFGLALQYGATLAAAGSAVSAVWILLRYFTIWASFAVALGFTALALRRRPAPPTLLGGLTLNILLVAIVYRLFLAGLLLQTRTERLADLFLHTVTPALVVLFWLLCVPRGALRSRDLAAWAAAPIGYLVYALALGQLDGFYPYPFLNVPGIGWAGVARVAGAIAAGYLAAGAALVWADRRLGRRTRVQAAATAPPPRAKPK